MSKDSKIKIIVGFFILLMIVLIYVKIKNDNKFKNSDINKISTIFENIDSSNTAKISKYFIYGTHINFEGNIEIPKISKISIYSTHLVIKDIDNNEDSLETTYTYKNNILNFSTVTNINTGISLEKLSKSDYFLFLKVIFSNNEVKYYPLENGSKYDNSTYYTLTKNNSNNKIEINFDSYNERPYIHISVTSVDVLPDNVYDIAIDASHGGKDTGCKTKQYTESELVLKYAKNLKQKLESSGYKVFLTRDGTESPTSDMANNMYDEKGRINISQESHSKILISLNINDATSKKGGLEIYAPTQCDLSFAKLLASNIVEKAKTSFSSVKSFKQEDGVYVRNYTNYDILGSKSSAILHKYKPYNITNSTTYTYMIREIGGIATNAFVDGRNTLYGKNKYFDSNIGIEGYSIELGYMKVEKDLNNIVKNENLYTQAISDSITQFYK